MAAASGRAEEYLKTGVYRKGHIMADEELEIEIDATGKVTMRTKGIKGPACMDYADLIAQIVGREENRQTTSEYYETDETAERRIDIRQRR
ncbi:MAG TPA: DUF2997 domain-containing protein [Tepidisphaeraceae bacterium]|nr:DUF2997 domain-containing protein [Tepidisphaeraceae bacterium]